MNKPAKPMREAMPTVAAWVDDLHEVGAECINASIRNGMAGGTDFYASENGHAIGCEALPDGYVVTAAEMILEKPVEEDDGRTS